MVISVNSENFAAEVTQSQKPVVMDIYASWCGPCVHMAPIFEEVAQEYSDRYKFVKLNVDEARDIAIQYGVTSIPTFVFIKNNEIKGRETGFMNKEEIVRKITTILG